MTNMTCDHLRAGRIWIIVALLALVLGTCLTAPVAAWAAPDGDQAYSAGGNSSPSTKDLDWYPSDPSQFKDFHSSTAPRVVDNADLLTNAEEAELLAHINDMRERLNMDFVFVSENSSYGLTRQQYAADFYTFNGYGVGEDFSGVIYFVCMEPGNRGFFTAACGGAQELMTEDNVNAMDDATIDLFKDGEYGKAIELQFNNLDTLYTEGELPVDMFPLALGGGGLIAFGLFWGANSLGRKKRRMKTVAQAAYAREYAVGTPVFTVNSDVITGTNVVRVPYVEPSSGGGGGSSFSGGFGPSGGGGSHSFSGGGRSF
ncbi:MAG: TPM domain-containing protein [Eggerthellales bacterium]|nr:TPM domain-containing protein [Eggerthellales bacterium]